MCDLFGLLAVEFLYNKNWDFYHSYPRTYPATVQRYDGLDLAEIMTIQIKFNLIAYI